ncbi:MAG: Acetolactate synthase small subunit, partial [uncultured Friedmanniella sp.]
EWRAVDAHAERAGREQAGCPGPGVQPDRPPRLQHRVARGGTHRVPDDVPDHPRGHRRRPGARADHQAAQQAGRGAEDRRAGGQLRPPRAHPGQGQ